MQPIFKNKTLIYQSKANFDVTISFGFGPEIRKMLVKVTAMQMLQMQMQMLVTAMQIPFSILVHMMPP